MGSQRDRNGFTLFMGKIMKMGNTFAQVIQLPVKIFIFIFYVFIILLNSVKTKLV